MGYFDLRGAFVAAVCAFTPVTVAAQDVVLSAKTGDQKVEGKLIEYDGEFFRVETAFGPVTVDARTVTCAGAACPDIDIEVETFSITGNQDLARNLLEAFSLFQGADIALGGSDPQTATITKDDTPLAKVTLTVGTVDGLRDGSDTIWISNEPAPDPSLAQIIGLDAVVIATSDVNPVETISVQQMQDVMQGAITNWKDLGGGDSDITLHVADGDAGFQRQVAALGLIPADGTIVTRHARIKDMADAVANDPFGLAVLPFSQLRTAEAMGLRGTCGMHNQADVFALQSGSYPMRYAIHAARPSKKLPLFAREFLEFLDSEQAQAVIADLGYADLGIGGQGLERQGQRLANSMMIIGKEVPLKDVREMTAIMSGATLLSATFRFQSGSTRLDGPSKANADALAAGLMLGNYADKVIYLMGFSDGEGRARQNKALSKERAEAVRLALVKSAPEGALDDVTFEVVGYGEASPLVCEDTQADAQINRRVEVWVKDRVLEIAPEE